MDDLVISLDEYNKLSRSGRVFNVLLATFLIILSTITVAKRISDGRNFGDYLFWILVLLAGINIILYTYGFFYRLSRRFVIIDRNGVEYKLSRYYPSRIYKWEELKKVEIKTLIVIFHSTGGSSSRMKLGEIFYSDIKKLKQKLAAECTEKGIEWSDTTVEGVPEGRSAPEAP